MRAGLILRQQHVRVHLGIARHDAQILQPAVELPHGPRAYPVGRLLAPAHEAYEIEVRVGDGRLQQLIVASHDAGVYHIFTHLRGSLNISPIIKSAESGSKGMKPPQ